MPYSWHRILRIEMPVVLHFHIFNGAVSFGVVSEDEVQRTPSLTRGFPGDSRLYYPLLPMLPSPGIF